MGRRVREAVPDRKTPDLKACESDLQSSIECKRFEPEQWEDWANELTHEIILQLPRGAAPSLPSFDILFERRLSDLEEPIRRGILEELAACIANAVRAACGSTPPTSIQIPGIGEVRIRSDKTAGQQRLGGIEISPQHKMRRITQNGILEAAKQLAESQHGAVVVYSDFTPPKELVEVVLGGLNRADESLLESIGLVVIPGSLGAAPVIWRNPRQVSRSRDQLAEDLERALVQTPARLLPAGSR